mgnify:CR=1 FL=1
MVEAIISSSDKNIPSFGESAFINMAIVNQLPSNIFSEIQNIQNYNLNVEKFEKFVFKKYNQYSLLKNDTTNFIDKSLENFLNIEFILNIFPKAKFLHCHRNLKDSIIGIYQSLLPEFSWTHSIENIINYIDNYKKIIEYFKKKYPDIILGVSLEDLTLNQEKVSKEIFKFCNLKWTPKVLEFYKREDLDIRTTSNIQIRNKITTYNKNKYSEYFYLFEDYESKLSWLK